MSNEKISVQFTEEMKGFVTFGEQENYERGFEDGEKSGTSFMFHLTITIPDIDFFIRDPEEQGIAEGYVKCPQLGEELPVEKGVFNCFVDVGQPGQNVKNMRYRLFIHDKDGRDLTFSGHKVVRDDGSHHIWRDTTTLFSKVLEGHVNPQEEETAKVLATGILHILPLDFARQLTTFHSNGPTFEARQMAILKFGKLFLGTLWEVYSPKIL